MNKLFKNRYRTTSARAAWWSYGWPGAYFITICTKRRRHFFGEIINYKMNLSPIGELTMNFWCEIPNHAHDVELGALQVMPNHFHGIIILKGTTSDSNSKTESNRKWLKVDNQILETANLVKNGLFVGTDNVAVNGSFVGMDNVAVNDPFVGMDNVAVNGLFVGTDNVAVNGSFVGMDNVAVNDPVETRHALSLPGTGTGTGTVHREIVCKTNADIKTNVDNPDSCKKPPPQSISSLRYQNQGTNTLSSIVGGYKSAVTRIAHLLKFTFDWQSGFHDHIIRNDKEYQRINDYIENNVKNWREDRFFTRKRPV